MKGLTNFQKAGLDKYLALYFKQNKCVTRTKKICDIYVKWNMATYIFSSSESESKKYSLPELEGHLLTRDFAEIKYRVISIIKI